MRCAPSIGCRLVVLTCTVLALFHPPVRGAALQVEVAAGLQGYYKPGKWLPVRVAVENTGVELRAALTIEAHGRRFIKPLVLPSPAKKAYALDIVLDDSQRELAVSLSTAGIPIATARAKLIPIAAAEPLVLVVGDTSWASHLLPPRHGSAPVSHVAYVPPEALPESWQGWQAVSAALLEMNALEAMRTEQRRALSRWLLLGGRLLLSGSKQRGQQADFSGQLLSLASPLTPPQTAGQATTMAVGLGTLIRRHEAPETHEAPTGLPSPGLWGTRLDGRPRAGMQTVTLQDSQIVQRLAAIHKDGTQRAGYFGMFVLLYVVLVALLCGIRYPLAPAWGWFAAMGAAAGAWALLSLWWGSIVFGGAILAQEVSLVHVFAKSSEQYVMTSALLRFPRRREYHLYDTPAAYYDILAAGDEKETLQYVFDAHVAPAGIRLYAPMWSQKRLLRERFVDRAWFPAESPEATEVVTNRSPFDLRHCYLLRADGVQRLPAAARGQRLDLGRQTRRESEAAALWAQPTLLGQTLLRYRNAITLQGYPDCVICALPVERPNLTSANYRVRGTATGVLIYHLGPPTPRQPGTRRDD